MHHTIFMPRYLVWRLVSTLVLLVSTLALSAQAQQEAAPPPTTIEVPLNTTRLVEMSKKQLIKEVRSDNPNIASIVVDTPRSALITARVSGRTRIFLIDENKNEEFADVIVPDDNEQKRRAVLRDVRTAVPTANIDIVVAGPNAIVTGVVGNPEDLPTVMAVVSSRFPGVVNAMRVGGVQQVQLDVILARVNRSEARNIAFSFLVTGQNQFVGSTVGGSGSLAGSIATSILAPSTSLTSAPNVVFGLLNDSNAFLGFLGALRAEGVARLLSQPSITTLSGRPAQILSGGETPILTSSGTGSPSVSYKNFGTVVDVLPLVLGDGTIHLDVQAEVSALNAGLGISIASAAGDTIVPGFDKRSAKAAVQMQDGQTLAIGGLIQSTVNGTATKVPILGDLPFVGAAFREMTYTEVEEELVILVTPRLVHAFGCHEWPKYLPGQETRSPDDFELFLEGILEAPRGPRSPCMGGRYHAAHTQGPTSVIYPCGGNGNGRCGPNGCHHGSMSQGHQTQTNAVPQPVTPAPVQATPARMAQPRTQPRSVPAIPATQPLRQPTEGRRFDLPVNSRPAEEREDLERPSTLPEVPAPPALGPVGIGEGPTEAQEDSSPPLPVPDSQEGPQ